MIYVMDLQGRIERWISLLVYFDFEVMHRLREKNENADYLSHPAEERKGMMAMNIGTKD